MKDAKGHGSNGRGGGFLAHDGKTYELAHRPGLYAHLGLTDAQSTQMIADKNSGQAKVARIAQAHGIQGGPIKVQTLNTKLSGVPFETKKSYRNNTIAEHVAKYMRIDGEHTRIKVRR